MPLLKKWWSERNVFSGTISFCFVDKLHFFERKIKSWNKESFGNIFVDKLAEEDLKNLNEKVIEEGMSNQEFKKV